MSERQRGEPRHVSPEVLKQALTEHVAPERLVVARGLFAGPSPQVPDEMYARIVRGKAHRERNALHLEHGATVDTNTFTSAGSPRATSSDGPRSRKSSSSWCSIPRPGHCCSSKRRTSGGTIRTVTSTEVGRHRYGRC